ncbi:MAG TPA: DUF6677 family protein [Thermoanaerobaculia bacterium]|nr:DUF6677 family protein [Thermoanaerobaculia bacterium]
MADPADSNPAATSPPPAAHPPVGNPYLAGALAWLIPGLGHIYVKRWRRGVAFFVLIIAAIWIGCALQGNLYRPMPNQPLSVLATFGAMGMGAPYFILRSALGYAGVNDAPGYEYGTAFLLTGGLMNLLLVLDAWDISRGKKD